MRLGMMMSAAPVQIQQQQLRQIQIITVLPQCRGGKILFQVTSGDNSGTQNVKYIRAEIDDYFSCGEHQACGLMFVPGSLEYLKETATRTVWEKPRDSFEIVKKGGLITCSSVLPDRICFFAQEAVLNPNLTSVQISWGRTEIFIFRLGNTTFTF